MAAGRSTAEDDGELAVTMAEGDWVASSGSVDAGKMCPGGVVHHIGYLELDGSPLAPEEGFERPVDGLFDDPLDEVADFLTIHELTCADGSGSFTVVTEDRNGGPWSVDGGIGAYTDLQASGTMEICV